MFYLFLIDKGFEIFTTWTNNIEKKKGNWCYLTNQSLKLQNSFKFLLLEREKKKQQGYKL